MMENKELLRKLLAELRETLGEINASAWPRNSDIKTAVNATFQVLEILIEEKTNG